MKLLNIKGYCMGVVKHSSNSSRFNDLVAQLGVNTVQEALVELDRRLDVLENAGPGGVPVLPLGFKDNIVPFSSMKTNAATEPLWADIGNGIYAFHFEDNKVKEVHAYFHINHDYKRGSKIYPHIHWMPDSTSVGQVKWIVEWVKAKGHGQGESFKDPLTIIELKQNGKGLDGEHMVIECTELEAFVVDEPDTIVLCKVSRDSTHVDDTLSGHAIGLMMDFHYQSESETTPGKTPETFYTGY